MDDYLLDKYYQKKAGLTTLSSENSMLTKNVVKHF